MNILVTGASKGIGYKTVIELLQSGDHRLLALSRSRDGLEKLAREVSHPGLSILPYDLLELRKEPEIFSQKIRRTFSGIDIILNNAGLLINKPFAALGYEEMQKIMETNFTVPAILIRQLLPLLSKGAHIVNISSMGGFQGSAKFPGLSVYSASKAALSSLTECLAEEFSEQGIRCNALAFGAVQTEMLNEAFPGYKAPLTAGEMAKFVSWFLLEGSRYFNGKILPVSLSTP